jgi:hypothetical protein
MPRKYVKKTYPANYLEVLHQHKKDKFFACVLKDSNDKGCWLWQAGKNVGGYGTVYGNTAHRLSWELHFGGVPAEMCVLHKCDVRHCVNPDHLFLGTYADNNFDRAVKGRNGVNAKPGAKLTERNVLAIKESTERVVTIAARFGVSEVTIYNIKNGITWR